MTPFQLKTAKKERMRLCARMHLSDRVNFVSAKVQYQSFHSNTVRIFKGNVFWSYHFSKTRTIALEKVLDIELSYFTNL